MKIENVTILTSMIDRRGRKYDLKELESQLNVKQMFGEFCTDYGDTYDAIDMSKVSHVVEDLRIEGENLVGTIRLLETTPNGVILSKLISEGFSITTGIRGAGIVNANNEISDYTLLTVDVVGVNEPT